MIIISKHYDTLLDIKRMKIFFVSESVSVIHVVCTGRIRCVGQMKRGSVNIFALAQSES